MKIYRYTQSLGMISRDKDVVPVIELKHWSDSEDSALILFYKNEEEDLIQSIKDMEYEVKDMYHQLNRLRNKFKDIRDKYPEEFI